jgi:DNA-3-methyladenine glycosylase
VLIRALEPTVGVKAMRERRGRRPDSELCSGPGKLTEALGIGLEHNEADLCAEPFLIAAPVGPRPEVRASPRVGITKATDRPWRFTAAGSCFVSRPRPSLNPR